jgi:hypothetical protein
MFWKEYYQVTRLLTPAEFAEAAQEAMNKAEDAAGVPRGSIIKAWLEEFNSRFEEKSK